MDFNPLYLQCKRDCQMGQLDVLDSFNERGVKIRHQYASIWILSTSWSRLIRQVLI